MANEFQNLKKGQMSVIEYATTFNEKMELVPYLIPTELSKKDKFANGLPTDFSPSVKSANTVEAAVQVARSLDIIIKGRTTNKVKVGEKMKGERILEPNKKGRFPKYGPNDKKPKDNNDAKW